jgi:hypothetical protein
MDQLKCIQNAIKYIDANLLEEIYDMIMTRHMTSDITILNIDCLYHICSFLNDIDYIRFISTNKYLKQNLNYSPLKSEYKLSKIYSISDNYKFTRIRYDYAFIVDKLPNSITHLTFEEDCDDIPVDNLPNSITHLTFGYWFNQPLDHLPNSITYLCVQGHFNQQIDNLPDSIIHLNLGWRYSKHINKLPQNLKKLCCHNKKLIKCDVSQIKFI